MTPNRGEPGKAPSLKKGAAPFAFQPLEQDRFSLDRLDLKFRWGHYGIHVLRCHLMQFAPGKSVSFHKHSEFEFHFIPRGKGKVILKDREFALHEGLFYLTGPDLIHYQEADAHEAMDELCLHIDIRELESGGSDNASAHLPEDDWGSGREQEEAETCIRRLRELPPETAVDRYNAMQWFMAASRAWKENQHGAYTTIKQAIIQILLRTVRGYEAAIVPEDASGIPQRDMNAFRFQLATRFIQDNHAGLITLENVAEKLSISGRQLQRIFREQAGVTFRDYVEDVRLSHICRELLEGDRTFEQMAVEHGFSGGNYLYYVFKRRMGMTPGQYRERQLEQAQP
ncbi:AraC family transcriptional regulator [Paenibacillus koleovorans]|uniref:AraC family transcriptional regulator n=1 Tax=Paenibacillus koleovorans TaxID=121608 RepID=UPI000FDBDFE4|nr:AraC family transcriptional regulator [Paenibacillus koleovorans]